MSKKNTFNYSEALAELETIVTKIENEEYGIDELSTQVKHAATILKLCREKLRETEKDVDDILKQMEE